ncbi:MAG: hypothetical protein IKM72_12055, partial [Oscillospiraceae bacterium]|nr:hypothetical protein [Oscillospiraceae bacterium]
MKNSMFKRFASVLVTFSLALSAFIFIPEKVNAYTQLVLNETVTLSDSDFVHYIGNFAGKGYDAEDDMQYAIVSFTPEETGYYYFDEIGKEWVNFYNIAPWSAEFDVSANRVDSYVNLLQGNRKPAYEMEQGITYYAIFSKSSESPKKLTIRKATEYFRVKPVQKEVAAVKDKTFTCELDLICSNPCTYSVEWTVNNTRQDTTGTKLTLNTNDYFDFAAGVNEGKVDYSLDILCKVYATYNGTTTSLGPYCLFDIIPYNSDFSSSVWAKSVKGNDSHELTYKKDGYSDKFFEVDAGSTDSNCNISYQWYLSTNEVDSNYNTIYTPLVGKTGSKIALKDLGDVNLTYDDLDGLSGTFQNAKCVVTFAKGSQRLTREVTFRVSYHFGISFTCFADDYKNIEDAVSGNIYNPRNITYSVKNGRNVTLPGANSIIESDLPDGLEFTYIWVESNSTYFNFYDFINHQENYNVLGTGKSITVNTTDLQKFNCEEGKASYVVLIAGYKFNGEDIRMQYNVNRTQTFELVYNNLVEPDEAGIAVNETNFPDNNFRSYVAANVDTNQSG